MRFSIVVSIVLSVIVSVGCSSAPTPTPTSIPPATKAPAAATKAPEATKAAPVATKAVAAPKTAPPASTVRVGLNRLTSDGGFYIALERGYFKEQNINIEVVPFSSATQTIAPMSTGQLEVAGGSATPGMFNATQRGIALKMVADKGSANPGMSYSAAVVRKDLWDSGTIRSFADFKGKNIALNAAKSGAAAHVDLDIALQGVGLSLMKDINIVDVGYPDMNAAFAGKAIDASMHAEPFMIKGIQQGLFTVLKNVDEIYPDHQIAVLVFAPHFAKDQTDAAKRFMVGYLKGVRDYNAAFVKKDKNIREAVIQALIKETTLKERELYDQAGFPGVNPDGYVNAESVTRDQDWFAASGFLTQKVNLKEVIDNQFVDYALQVLGKYQK
ncbi:MAG: ABC transporter substrate-binding protein [Chloroflexi bacterium]|nr:ABC transporter substrate-binding protein [Chloroflexota bacterium]